MRSSFRFQGVTFVLLACALSAHAGPAARPGDLEQRVIDTFRYGDDLSDCERTPDQKKIRLALARAFDQRAKELAEYFANSGRASRQTYGRGTRIGPLNLSARPNPKGSEWSSTTSGWTDFAKEFQAIQSTRMGPRWARLSDLVRATIADDYRRAAIGTWMGVSAQGVNQAPAFVNLVLSCLNEKKCDGLTKPDAFKAVLALTPDLAEDYDQFRQATSGALRERALKTLLRGAKPFLTYFEPVKQKGVRLSGDHTLIVSLDAGDFRSVQTELGLVIEKFWKVGEDELKVEWMTSTRDSPIFKFEFLPTTALGGQIDFRARSITLGQEAPESLPAFEVGRALGFRARYFSVWRPDLCKYEDQSKSDDLLSDGRSGSVNPAHWESLKKAYTPAP